MTPCKAPIRATPAQSARPNVATADLADSTLRVGVLGGWFRSGATDAALAAVDAAAAALGAAAQTEIPEAARARAAAFCITAAEGGNLHFEDLKSRPQDFDRATRSRFLAGTLVPANVVLQAQRFRAWFRAEVLKLFADHDILLSPVAPCSAPRLGQTMMTIDGRDVPVRPNLGLYTQPISFIGLPVVSAPVHRPGEMPHGVQIIAAPWAEATALRAAAMLERAGVVAAPVV